MLNRTMSSSLIDFNQGFLYYLKSITLFRYDSADSFIRHLQIKANGFCLPFLLIVPSRAHTRCCLQRLYRETIWFEMKSCILNRHYVCWVLLATFWFHFHKE